jgi:hypothetical protein
MKKEGILFHFDTLKKEQHSDHKIRSTVHANKWIKDLNNGLSYDISYIYPKLQNC